MSKPTFNGTFEVIDGKLSFTCHTQDVSFDEVRTGLIELRDEINRQLFNETLCPFYQAHGKGADIERIQSHPERASAMENYDNFWREHVTTDGVLDEQKVANELSDYSHIMEQISLVYCYVANLSKIMYFAGTIQDQADEQYRRQYMEKVKDFANHIKSERMIRQATAERIIDEVEKFF